MTPNEVFLEAQPVDSVDLFWDFIKRPKGLALVACLVVALLILIVGCVLGVGSLRDDHQDPQIFSSSPSYAPSQSPTQAPTVEFNLELLPKFTSAAIRNNPLSPQARALEWILRDPFLQDLEPAIRKVHRFGLATLYFATNGDQWTDATHWLSYEHHECEWFSTATRASACSNNGTLRTLQLSQNALSGQVPPEIGLIAGLMSVDLSDNSLEGAIPSTIGMLSNSLEGMQLSWNAFRNSIPSDVGRLTKLKALSLSHNELRGSIITEFGNLIGLTVLDVRHNSLFGQLPSELGRLESLRELGTDICGRLANNIGWKNLPHFSLFLSLFI